MMQQITIVGTGLIGGSLALALKHHGFPGRIIGVDRPEILREALERRVVDVAESDPVAGTRGSDVVVLCTPVGGIIDLMERLGPVLGPDVLLTDTGSTKSMVVERARQVFGAAAAERFLALHPMAGKEISGIAAADPALFQNAVWLATPLPKQDVRAGRPGEYLAWVERIGGRVVNIDVQRHDRLCAWISHLPQMLATALASSLEEEFGDDQELHAIGGRALREMTRIAASPYSMWRDIALTNAPNIEDALAKLEQRLMHIRENLRNPELRTEFEQAQRFRGLTRKE